MKKNLKNNYSLKLNLPIWILLGIFTFFGGKLYAQGDSSSSKTPISISASYTIINGIKSVKIVVTKKEEDKTIPVSNLIVNLYHSEIKKLDLSTGYGWAGNLVTNNEGEGTYRFSKQFYTLTQGKHSFNFILTTNNDPIYEDTEESFTMIEPILTMDVNTQDSINTVTSKISNLVDGKEAPIAEAELKLLIKRAFGYLPFGEDGATTDESGEITGELPMDLPGNANKTLTLVARFVDDDGNGTIEVTKDIPWKIPPIKNVLNKRTLWSTGSNAPLPLVIITVSLILIIWGVIAYLALLLIKIRKLSKVA